MLAGGGGSGSTHILYYTGVSLEKTPAGFFFKTPQQTKIVTFHKTITKKSLAEVTWPCTVVGHNILR
jgi:hypothetical protein